MLKYVLLVSIFAYIAQASLFGSTQSVAVKGKLLCGTKPASDVRVKIVDDDTGLDPDDEMDAGYTDNRGEFRLAGNTKEMSTIDPFLKIYHDCNDGVVCNRKWRIKIPKHYICKMKEANVTLDIGVWNLEVALDGEERDCDN